MLPHSPVDWAVVAEVEKVGAGQAAAGSNNKRKGCFSRCAECLTHFGRQGTGREPSYASTIGHPLPPVAGYGS